MGKWNPLNNTFEPTIRTKVVVAPRHAWEEVKAQIAAQDPEYRVVLVFPETGAAKVQALSINSWETHHCSPRDQEEITKSGLRDMLNARLRP